MVLDRPNTSLVLRERPVPSPGPGDILIEVEACGVCRTDLHVVDGDLPSETADRARPRDRRAGWPMGPACTASAIGSRVGVPWLGWTCGVCPYCRSGRENLCDRPLFTGYTRDGGFAVPRRRGCRVIASLCRKRPIRRARAADVRRADRLAQLPHGRETGANLGIYGFGAAAHILAQVAVAQGRRVYAFTRTGDTEAQNFARRSARRGPAAPRRCRRAHSTPRSSSLPSARWCRRLACGEKGRPRRLRRHSHVGHSELSLPHPVGGAAGRSRSRTSPARMRTSFWRWRRRSA